jgi:hypothetical protein
MVADSNRDLKMEIERRRHPRFSVRDNAFAVFQPEPVKLVPIVDIGLGGLGIGVNGINTGYKWLNRASCLEILIDDCSFYMDNLGYELLPKFRSVPRNAASPFQKIYGLKFVDLEPGQQYQLKSFIRNHTTGGMTPKFIRKFNQHFRQFLDKRDYGAACRNISPQPPPL